MNFLLTRKYLGEKYTIGKFGINSVPFCDILEDKVRDYNKDGDLDDPGETKVYGETAIAYGRYRVVLRYSPKFKRKLPALLGVKGFEGILMHRGNWPKDTLGCLLVGENLEKGSVSNSTKYEEKLVKLLEEAESRGEETYITIV